MRTHIVFVAMETEST